MPDYFVLMVPRSQRRCESIETCQEAEHSGGGAPTARLMPRPHPVIPGRYLCLHPPGPGVGAASSRARTTPARADGTEGGGRGQEGQELWCGFWGVSQCGSSGGSRPMFCGALRLYTLEDFYKENTENCKYKIKYKYE